MTAILFDGPDDARATFIFAHGAGGPMDSAFMNDVARNLAAGGIRVARFEFPYMARRRAAGGGGGAPDRPPVLLQSYRDVVQEVRSPGALFIGGKSMGGRMASMVADELGVSGLICFGYPFHPPGAPTKLRTEHLADLRTPALFLQGERDQFGSRDEVASYTLSPSIRLGWIAGGDHSFKPAARSGTTLAKNIAHACDRAAEFLSGLA